MTTLKRAIIKSYSAATHRATVQIAGSLSVWLADVPVSHAIPPAAVIGGREGAVLLFTDDNPDDAVLVTVHGGAAPVGVPAGSLIQDADNDTFVETELTADEDRIRMSAINGVRVYGGSVEDDDANPQDDVGIFESLNGTDLIYLVPTPGTGFKTLTFPKGFQSKDTAVMQRASGTILTVQPPNNNATGSVTAVQGIAKSGGSAGGQTVRGLDYLVGANTGSGTIATLSAIRAGIDSPFSGGLVTTTARLIEGYLNVHASWVPTTLIGVEIPNLTVGTNRRPFVENGVGTSTSNNHGNRFRSNTQFGSLTGAFGTGDG